MSATRAFLTGLLVVAFVAAAVALTVPRREHDHTAEHTSAPPHVERPAAGVNHPQVLYVTEESLRIVFLQRAYEQQQFTRFLEALGRAHQRASTSRHTTSRVSSGFLACVKTRESEGDYRAVNPSSGTGGAWQFKQSTWDATARHSGRYDLVGTRPQDASPADQDAMAQSLYAWQGTSPWAGGRYAC